MAQDPHGNMVDVLLVIEDDIATTQLLERVLLACSPHGLRYTKRYLHQLSVDDVAQDGLPLLVRTGAPTALPWARLLGSARLPYIYYIDDNFWELRGDSALALYYQSADVRKTLNYLVSHADLVLTNSEQLTDYLRGLTPNILCIPAFFDFSLIQSAQAYQGPERRIGFAGSPSRADDLALLVPAIHAILEEFSDVVFEFAGVLPPGICAGPRVRFHPHQNSYEEFIRFQASRGWCIGLAPLLRNQSNRFKTNNKFREYGACRIAGIYTDMEPYAMVVPGKNGLLVGDDPGAWTAAIRQLLRQPELLAAIAGAAETDVLRRYSVDVVAQRWAQAIAASHAKLTPMDCEARAQLRRRARWITWKSGWMSLHMQVAVSFSEGGTSLVLKRSFWRLIRCARTGKWNA